jgi:ABC-type multidrug transport system ATPase subunit
MARRDFWDMIIDMAADGMTVLVSTHYMDEAERCHRVVYLSGGRLIVQGRAEDVVREAKIAVFEATGAGLDVVARRLRGAPGAESVTVFGGAVRAVGTDQAALESAIATAGGGASVTWRQVPARLDDVFIHLLRTQGNA